MLACAGQVLVSPFLRLAMLTSNVLVSGMGETQICGANSDDL